jgi:G3E family GTPase
MKRASIPAVSLVTGFLGSGKTTLLNRLLRDPALERAAVIVNEFGEIPLDHLLIATPKENTVLLANGCVCCTVRGDLVDTLRGLARRRWHGELPPFDRVLIETTGLADPVPIVQTLVADEAVAPHYRLDGVVTLVDAVNGLAQLDAHPEAVKQAALADRLLIAKCDLASARQLAAFERRLARINPGAPRLHVAHGKIAPRDLLDAGLGSDVVRWLNADAFSRTGRGHAGERICAFCFYLDKPVHSAGMVTWLTLLAGMRGANLLRVKALLNVEGDPVAVHAVQTVIHEPVRLEHWPDAERRSRLVFITLDMAREEVARTLAALQFDAGAQPQRGALDPEAYARFVAMAQGFR